MDIATSRNIKHAARHVTAARWNGLPTPTGLRAVSIEVAIGSLGFLDSRDVLAPGGLDRLAAEVRVRHGEAALLVFQLYVSLQILITSVGRGGVERQTLFDVADTVDSAVEGLGLDGVDVAMEGIYQVLRDDHTDGALEDRIGRLSDAVDGALGLVPTLRHGGVPDLGVSYAEVYRVAVMLGRLRADDLLSRDPAQWAVEMNYALALLGCPLDGHEAPASAEDVTAHWLRVEATLGIVVGGLAEEVFRAAMFHATCVDLSFPGLALRKALGDLAGAIAALGHEGLSREVSEAGQALVGLDLAEEEAEPVELIVLDRVEEWLEDVLPRVGFDAVLRGHVTVCEDRFSGYVVPVTASVPFIYLYSLL